MDAGEDRLRSGSNQEWMLRGGVSEERAGGAPEKQEPHT